MTAPRKMKLQDRGTPEPKPSRKVVLDELLRSLQDLVSHELNVEASGAPARPAAPPPDLDDTVKPAAADRPEVPTAEPAPATAGLAAPEPDTITLEVVPASEAPPEPVAETVPDEAPATLPAEPVPIPVAAPSPTAKVPPEGLQQELPYLDTSAIAAPAPAPGDSPLLVEPPMELPELASTEPAPTIDFSTVAGTELLVEPPNELPDLPDTGLVTTGPAATGAEPAVAPELLPPPTPAATAQPQPAAPHVVADTGPSDIPLLEDAVDLHEVPVPAMTGSPALPADGARRLAIQVAARLNVELRKQNKDVLASDVIARLAHLLEEALAKAATNMDNTRPEKH